jgi:hypothetical protein
MGRKINEKILLYGGPIIFSIKINDDPGSMKELLMFLQVDIFFYKFNTISTTTLD